MTAQQLKNSILQMAVQGKLVPQDPNDEPASVLLERIRAEKERLIKEKKIKREKNPSVIFKGADNTPYEKIGDEVRSLAISFDIPDGWVWIHPTDIGYFGSGKTPTPDQLSKFGTVPYFKVADMNAAGNEIVLCNSNSFLKFPDSMKLFSKGAVVYPKNGGAVFTNKKRILGQDSLVDLNTGSYTPFSQMDEKFFYYLFSTVDFQKYYKGTALPTVDMDAVQEIVWALPPLAEQKRIVTAIELSLPLIDKYEETHSQLSRLQNSFPEALKKSILQEAVQGKLVPQDPSDEPAEALLGRIRAEKQRLIKEGKIKKDKHESVIFRRDNSHYEKRGSEEVCIDEEIPFEIPENWAWCRASSLGTMIRGRGIKRTETVAQGCPCIRYGEIYTTYETSFDSAVSFVPETLDKDCLHFSYGDVVFTLTGENKVDIAKTVAFLGEGQIAAGGDLAFWTHHGMNPLYLVYYMASPYCIELKRRTATGDIIVHISTSKVGDFLVPIPPIKEQNRIVSAIEQLFAVASTL